jgi:hypothetical protein
MFLTFVIFTADFLLLPHDAYRSVSHGMIFVFMGVNVIVLEWRIFSSVVIRLRSVAVFCFCDDVTDALTLDGASSVVYSLLQFKTAH